jgi:galactose mutarotase-like enzyme
LSPQQYSETVFNTKESRLNDVFVSKVQDTTLNQLRLLVLENESISLSILPEVGAKILTLLDKKSHRNILWENLRTPPQTYPIDANFDNYWCGGWDDAFPTADACIYKGEPIPNVGELRSLSWKVEELKADAISATARLTAYGPIHPIKATKTVSLRGRTVEMGFDIENIGPIPVDYLWGTHPAFAVEAGTRLFLPAKVGIVAQSNHPSLGAPGDRYEWPLIQSTDMSVVPPVTAGIHCGHYATELQDGWFAVETDGRGILYEFPVEKCPHLWLWLVYGGWRGHYHAVVEPWTGYPVILSEAVEQGRHSQLAPGETFSVTIRCTPYHAPETHAEALARIRKN